VETPAPPGKYDLLLDKARARLEAEGALGPIRLIKELRDATGLSLAEAKAAVDDYTRRNAATLSTGFDARAPLWVTVVAGIVTAVVVAAAVVQAAGALLLFFWLLGVPVWKIVLLMTAPPLVYVLASLAQRLWRQRHAARQKVSL
jgi:hypothetical protein